MIRGIFKETCIEIILSNTAVSLSIAPAQGVSEQEKREPAKNIELTIGMATYNDFDGIYFTLQALQLYQDMENTELLVIDNYGCQETQKLVEEWLHGRYILARLQS